MREFAITLATMCVVGGLVLAAMPPLENKAVSWFVGFCVGCLAASMLWTLAVFWAM